MDNDVGDVEEGGEGEGAEQSQMPPSHCAQHDFIPSCLPAPVQDNLRKNHP